MEELLYCLIEFRLLKQVQHLNLDGPVHIMLSEAHVLLEVRGPLISTPHMIYMKMARVPNQFRRRIHEDLQNQCTPFLFLGLQGSRLVVLRKHTQFPNEDNPDNQFSAMSEYWAGRFSQHVTIRSTGNMTKVEERRKSSEKIEKILRKRNRKFLLKLSIFSRRKFSGEDIFLDFLSQENRFRSIFNESRTPSLTTKTSITVEGPCTDEPMKLSLKWCSAILIARSSSQQL
jgi:hypothetical protein